jgi:hypothetical protein
MYLAWFRDFSFSHIEKICHIKIQVVFTIYVAAIVIPYLNCIFLVVYLIAQICWEKLISCLVRCCEYVRRLSFLFLAMLNM